jgi:hypothetical protein
MDRLDAGECMDRFDAGECMDRLDAAILNFANAPTNRWIFQVALCLKKKIEVVPMHSMQADRGSRGTAPLILTLGTR